MNNVEIIVEERLRLERMRDDLISCRYENELDFKRTGGEVHRSNIREIDMILPKINQKYDGLVLQIDE